MALQPLEIRDLVRCLCLPNPPAHRVNEFVFLCQKIALVQLRRRVKAGRLNRDFIALQLDDVAIDCVADLFRQDERGVFPHVKTYFDGLRLDDLSNEELLSHVRRLVFSRVSHGLFRIYNEIDPGLGKILRNIKLAVQSLQNFTISDRFGELCLAPTFCETLEHLPSIDRLQLDSYLGGHVHGSETIPAILAALSRCLREQQEFSRIVPLITVAMTIRSIYGRADGSMETTTGENQFVVGETSAIIRETCIKMKRDLEKKYIDRGKVSKRDFDLYFVVIEDITTATILGHDGHDPSYYDRLSKLKPEMTKEEYQQQHKAKLEYLARLTYDMAIGELRKHS